MIIHKTNYEGKGIMEEKESELDDKQNPQTQSFEDSLNELQRIVDRMERGDQSLETSLDEFERGIKLVQECQRRLEQAQQRVEMLTAKDGEFATAPFSQTQAD